MAAQQLRVFALIIRRFPLCSFLPILLRVLFSSQEDAHLLSWACAVQRFITFTHTHPLCLALVLQCYYTFAEIGGGIDLGCLCLCPGQFKLAYLLAFDILGVGYWVGCCSFVRVSSLVRFEKIVIRFLFEFYGVIGMQ